METKDSSFRYAKKCAEVHAEETGHKTLVEGPNAYCKCGWSHVAKKEVAKIEEVVEAVIEKPTTKETKMAIDLPEMPAGVSERDEKIEDKVDVAIRTAFIGSGQGGGRLVQSIFDLGYNRVCVVNTTEQDMEALTLPNKDKSKLVIGKNKGGAGKDPEQGKQAAQESFEEIVDLMNRSWGEGVDQIMICVGGGGGSGTGSLEILLNAAEEYAKITNIEKPVEKHIGVILTLPKRSEGARVQKNALGALQLCLQQLEQKKLSTLIIIDNAKINDLYPRLPVKGFWDTANKSFATIFHTFNILGAQSSEYHTFDKEDFKSILRNGLVLFGMTSIQSWKEKEDISVAVRQNLKGSILADGVDLSTATMAGAIVVAHGDILMEIPMENIDYAFYSLGRVIGNEGITLHNGIYEGKNPGLKVFTIVSGMKQPAERIEELQKLSK